MRHALFLPAFDGLADPRRLIEVAQCAEAAGWDGFFLWDHLLYSEPVGDILDPYVCLGVIAAATRTIALGPMVTPLVRRRPQVLARQALTLDHLSNGRLVLGLGIGDDGGPGGELSGFGEMVDARTRGRQLDEGLEVLTALLSGDEVRHQGEFYRAMDVTFRPTAVRPDGIPIWLAARWPHRRPVRRAARYQGVVVIQMDGPAAMPELRAELAASGAAMDSFDVVVLGHEGDSAAAWAAAGVTWLLTQVGPFHVTYEAALGVAAAGPPAV